MNFLNNVECFLLDVLMVLRTLSLDTNLTPKEILKKLKNYYYYLFFWWGLGERFNLWKCTKSEGVPFCMKLLLLLLLLLLFKSRLSLIVRVNIVLNRTVVVDSDWRFDNMCGSHLQSQSELYCLLVIDLIGYWSDW